ncbi:hypothetical protein ELY11_04925 [Legionella septentrionalis]|nr:hypothetical protein ELY11_04925 [Legionella septentrionalis]
MIVSLDKKADAVEKIKEWISKNNIRILNVAGPRI